MDPKAFSSSLKWSTPCKQTMSRSSSWLSDPATFGIDVKDPILTRYCRSCLGGTYDWSEVLLSFLNWFLISMFLIILLLAAAAFTSARARLSLRAARSNTAAFFTPVLLCLLFLHFPDISVFLLDT